MYVLGMLMFSVKSQERDLIITALISQERGSIQTRGDQTQTLVTLLDPKLCEQRKNNSGTVGHYRPKVWIPGVIGIIFFAMIEGLTCFVLNFLKGLESKKGRNHI